MTFALTPLDPPTWNGLPGDWIQFRGNGVDKGDANVAVLDIVADPTSVIVTRGVGENAHIITIRRFVGG